MSELESFYSNVYKERNCLSSSFLDDLTEFPTLTEDLRNVCGGQIEYNEWASLIASLKHVTVWENHVAPND